MATEPSYRWDMLNEKKYGGISCLATSDLTGDGLPDILVGRDDGVVEVYGLDDSSEPRLCFTHVSSHMTWGGSTTCTYLDMYIPGHACAWPRVSIAYY